MDEGDNDKEIEKREKEGESDKETDRLVDRKGENERQ